MIEVLARPAQQSGLKRLFMIFPILEKDLGVPCVNCPLDHIRNIYRCLI